MDENPYDILGVARDASLDEVKRAYRKKARENHPDLNPDDPAAEERMNKVNEAYDRIVNPEKYRATDARKQRQSGYSPYSQTGQNPQGGTYYNPFSGTGGQGNNTGYTTWTTIDFDDLFGGFQSEGAAIHPEPNASDSPEIQSVIANINARNYNQAIETMQQIPSYGRDARWYYLFALANNGANNTVAAHDNIKRARQLDPNNMDYIRAENSFNRRAQTYTQQGQGRGFTSFGIDPNWLCCCVCLGPTICSYFSRMCMYGFYC